MSGIPKNAVNEVETVHNVPGQIGHSTELTTMSEKEPAFAQSLKQYQARLDRDFHDFDTELQHKPRDQELDQTDWSDLQKEFEQEVEMKIEEEAEIMRGFESRMKQFMLWMQVSHERETERAIKRLKTQSLFVQNSENRLVEKEQHYEKVMTAFQSAMRLLTQTS